MYRLISDADDKIERPRNPRANANIFEILTFSWLFDLFRTGRQRDLDVKDLYTALPDHTSSRLGSELEKKWKSELANANKANKNPSLLKVLARMFGYKIMLYGIILSFGEIVLKMSQPLLIRGLLTSFNPDDSKNTDLAHACMYASFLTLSMLASTFLYHSTQIEMFHTGMKIRIACCSAIFNKALRLSNTALGETTVGHVANLVSNDVNRFDGAFAYFQFIWISPLQTMVATYFIWQEVGVSSILGLAACFMFIPLQGWLGKKTSEYRFKTAIKTDKRVHLMNEIIMGIRVIKMYTWEKPFAYLVQCARKKEIEQIRKSSFIRSILSSFVDYHTKMSLFLSIISYVLLGNYISASKVFVITSYYSLLQVTMTLRFPMGIGKYAEMLVSIKRIQNFLMYEEKYIPVEKFCKTAQSGNFGIVISNATAKWAVDQSENSLENINLTVGPGQLVAITGPVGAGKSSLLQGILRELPLSEGRISVHGVISYASQEPWLFAGSVQQNILFGLPMNRERYEEVIYACALKLDFEQLPFGDRTIVGERGVSLSGGQRARINLARAIYKQADIYLLDDPLSAVDANVGRHLFEKCVKGFLKEKTCILVTHQLQYLASVNKIVLMNDAKVLAESTYEELQKSNLDFAKLFRSPVEDTSDGINYEIRNGDDIMDDNTSVLDGKVVSSQSNASLAVEEKKANQEPVEIAETKVSGNISRLVYFSYITAGGSCCKILFFIFICVSTQLLSSGGDLWITHWVNLEDHSFRDGRNSSNISSTNTDDAIGTFMYWSITRQTCIVVFAGLTFIMVVATTFKSVTFVSICMRASMNLHNKMFEAITRATMFFFDTNSSGSILNRFSKDIGAIDEILPLVVMDTINVGLNILGIVIVVGLVNIYLMIPTFIVVYVSYKLSDFYLSTSRSIKRLEGIMRSPVFAHFNATLQGLTTVRAFEAEQILSKEFDNHQDLHSSAWYISITSIRALGVWMDVICIAYTSIVSFSFIVFDNNTYSGNVGLAITQTLGLVGSLQWGIRQSTDLENQMTSVERVLEYTNVTQEGAIGSSPNKKSPPNWPSNGRITFKNFHLRYSQDAPYVIKNLDVNIEPNQKIGIVGRTGAGKSSLITGLFRLASNEGSIIIDGVEIHELMLHELRSKISIIPQEPVLFSGTMRKNLDPIDEYPDHVLWNALDEVELKDVVEDMPKGLNSKMSEGGSNFSVGQRQLVCLARAIIRQNKILILDEATANVDPRTDSLIQNTIRNKFQDCTVLTIAHRLHTVMDSDRLLVMDAGKMVEFDHPHNLLKNKNGFLHEMVEQTGRATADLLHDIAAEGFERRNMTIQSQTGSQVNGDSIDMPEKSVRNKA